MNVKFSLDQLRVSSPCEMSWEEMRGNEKARFCDSCQKHVYNFAAMTIEEGFALIEKTEGEFCGRLTRRSDGTLMTADCPVGLAAKARRFRRRLVYSAIAAGMMVVGLVSLRQVRTAAREGVIVEGPSVTDRIEEWVDDVRVWAGFPPLRAKSVVMGGCPAPTPGK